MSATVNTVVRVVEDKGVTKQNLKMRINEINTTLGREAVRLMTVQQNQSLKPFVHEVALLRGDREGREKTTATLSDIDNTIVKHVEMVLAEGLKELWLQPILSDTVEDMYEVDRMSELYYVSARPARSNRGEDCRESTFQQLSALGFPAEKNRVLVGHGDPNPPNLFTKGQAIYTVQKWHPAVRKIAFQDDRLFELKSILESAFSGMQLGQLDNLLLCYRQK